MREEGGQRIYSATDLVNYLGCTHATFCDLRQLVQPVTLPAHNDYAVLLQEKGIEHERAYLAQLRKEGRTIAEINGDEPLYARVAATCKAMRDGADVIYQGALLASSWHGFSDFLLRANGTPSLLGDFAYDVADTKLARSAKPKHVVQLCVYADLLEAIQHVEPPQLHILLGNGQQVSLRTSVVRYYYGVARGRFEAFVAAPPPASGPEPCSHCTFCRWKESCEAEWEATDHLSLVANINRTQIDKLKAAGIVTLHELASIPDAARIPNLRTDTLWRLRAQAKLQVTRRDTGNNQYELLRPSPARGFERLPKPDPGDLFFDMEGDPFYEMGLEYLFGLVHLEGEAERFTSYWAHNREMKRRRSRAPSTLMTARLAAYPDAHMYHYAQYEKPRLSA